MSTDPGTAASIDDLRPGEDKSIRRAEPKPLSLKNGLLLVNDFPLVGGRQALAWWKGEAIPAAVPANGAGVTRFVPGRVGPGYTDDLDELTDRMRASARVVLDHHYGLWYDRRRDDHQMVRRADGEVWPPFYELPWARSGRGTAWDGLSRYDLTRFNPWYFARLKEAADLCDRKGLVFVQQMYFQHNILEAGAHWADCPWRPANCLQPTGFPEPPDYAGGKRVFMADAFYEVAHPVRRELHRAYIRHCLDVLGRNTNVIFQTGEEFTGPLHFMKFWIDTVGEWQKETGRKVLVGLSCTKDVQDAILSDPVRGPLVSVVDMKYWWYTADGKTFDPKGGENLAPRQQLREWKGGSKRSDASVARQVREYRLKYPDKAVTCSLDGVSGWAVAAAGGSIAHLPVGTDAGLLAALARMRPIDSADAVTLADPGRDYLVYAPTGGTITLDISGRAESFTARWVDLRTGRPTGTGTDAAGGSPLTLIPLRPGPALLWVTRR